jgi:dGTPase
VQDILPEQRPPLEAQLIDLADEIAYTTADLDDGFSAGLISLEEIAGAVPLAAHLAEQVDTQFPGASARVRFWEIQRQLMNVLIGGLIDGTLVAVERSRVQDLQDVRALDYRLAQMTPEAAELNRQLRGLLVQRVYSHSQLTEDRSSAVNRMAELFTFLVEHSEHVPRAYREHFSALPVERIVCDYVAGMTDAFLTRVHREFLG